MPGIGQQRLTAIADEIKGMNEEDGIAAYRDAIVDMILAGATDAQIFHETEISPLGLLRVIRLMYATGG